LAELIIKQIDRAHAQRANDFLKFASGVALEQPAAVPVVDAEATAPVVMSGATGRPAVSAGDDFFQSCEKAGHDGTPCPRDGSGPAAADTSWRAGRDLAVGFDLRCPDFHCLAAKPLILLRMSSRFMHGEQGIARKGSSAANVGTEKDSDKRQRASIEAFGKRVRGPRGNLCRALGD
jgi:hypothetical protein